MARTALPFDDTPGAPWLWLPPDPRAGFERVRALGVPLAQRADLRPRLGVKCGCNEAFVVEAHADGSVTGSDGCRGVVEPQLLRPLLRGEGVTPWTVALTREQIIFPHDGSLRPLTANCRRWHASGCSDGGAGSAHARTSRDALPGGASFASTPSTDQHPRVVWADLARSPRAAVIDAGNPVVPLNSCYIAFASPHDEAHALAAWLNSPLAAAWLAALAEPARGGFRRMLGWTVGLLPLPRDWDRAVDLLAPFGARATAGRPTLDEELLDVALRAHGASRNDVEALITWGHR